MFITQPPSLFLNYLLRISSNLVFICHQETVGNCSKWDWFCCADFFFIQCQVLPPSFKGPINLSGKISSARPDCLNFVKLLLLSCPQNINITEGAEKLYFTAQKLFFLRRNWFEGEKMSYNFEKGFVKGCFCFFNFWIDLKFKTK